MEYKLTVSKMFKHFHTVNRHRFKVFTLCCRVGVPFRGLMHDLSKYYPQEFFESAKYYQGDYSPITNCKRIEGYSKAWLHHKGRNKHHYEYWFDFDNRDEIIMPFKYFLEMICDTYAAGMIYCKDKWTPEYQENYWKKVRGSIIILNEY